MLTDNLYCFYCMHQCMIFQLPFPYSAGGACWNHVRKKKEWNPKGNATQENIQDNGQVL